MKKKNNMSWVIPVLLLVGLAIYRKFASDKVENTENDKNNTEDGDPDEDKNPPSVLRTQVKKGSRGEAVKKCQQRANSIIHLVRTKKSDLIKALPEKEQRIKQIASLKQLVTDGVFGSQTEAIVLNLTGNKVTSLYTLRQKYKYWNDNAKTGGLAPNWMFIN